MKNPISFSVVFSLVAGWFFLLPAVASAQMEDLEPRWLRLDIPQASVGMEVEGLTESVNSGGSSTTHEQLSLAPLVGLRTQGSIYHPNLISFSLDGETGWNWVNDSVKSSGSSTTRSESGDLLRYLVQARILPGKPYNATVFAAQDHTFRNYDSFNSYTVDTTRYGGRFNWATTTLELNADVGYRDEKSTGISSSSEIAETFFSFYGIQKRERAQTTVSYRYDEFDNVINSGGHQNSSYHAVGVSDYEAFGSRRQIGANTSASFSQSEYSGQETKTVIMNENITVKNRPNVETYLTLNFGHSSMSTVTSANLQGAGGVRHQLYESLSSALDAHGSYDETTSAFGSSANARYGLGLHENYTKRLGNWGRLSAGVGIVADHEEHESSGSVLTIFDEHHNLTNIPVFLNNPRVLTATITVRAAADGFPYTLGVDYTLNPVGELTQILPVLPITGDVDLHGSEILVNYDSESLFNAAFESFNTSAQIRLDLFNHFGLYARMNQLDNNAPPEALTQTLTDIVMGADCSWRWFRASAEYEDYDSNFSQYQAWRFLQSFNCQPTDTSTFGVDFSQNFYRYQDNFNQDQYQFLARYNAMLDFSLAWYLEGGYAIHEVSATEQNSGFGRTGLTWSRGKLSVRAGYEYNYQNTKNGVSTDQRDRNRFFTYLKRTF